MTRATIALVLACLMWGTTGTVAHFMPPEVSPVAIGAATMGVGGVLLFLASARGALAAIRDPAARRWLALGAVGVAVYPLAFYPAMNLAGVAIGNVVSLGTGPVFAALLEWVWERRPLSRRWALCTAAAIGGVALLAFGRGDQVGPNVPAGIGLGLIAGLAYALYTYAASRAIRTGHHSRAVMGGMFGIGAIPLWVVLLFLGAPILNSWSSIGIAAYLAIGPTFLGYLLFGIGLRSIRSSAATTITLLEPVVATALAVLVVGERLSVLGWAGLVLIVVAVTALVTARRPVNT